MIAALQRPKGMPSGAPYPHRKAKETHELILFLVVIMASGIAPEHVCTMTTSFDTYQNKLFTDQYYMIILQAQI